MSFASRLNYLIFTRSCFNAAETEAEGGLKDFKSQKQGYLLRVPSSWEQKEKAGKG